MDKVAGFLSSVCCHGVGDKAHILARRRDLQHTHPRSETCRPSSALTLISTPIRG